MDKFGLTIFVCKKLVQSDARRRTIAVAFRRKIDIKVLERSPPLGDVLAILAGVASHIEAAEEL
jgi:hypothetical protein